MTALRPYLIGFAALTDVHSQSFSIDLLGRSIKLYKTNGVHYYSYFPFFSLFPSTHPLSLISNPLLDFFYSLVPSFSIHSFPASDNLNLPSSSFSSTLILTKSDHLEFPCNRPSCRSCSPTIFPLNLSLISSPTTHALTVASATGRCL